jgi:hypothetical protein
MPPAEPVELIRCWSCGVNRGLVELFDAATEVICQPVCDGFSVKCPDCREELWLEFTATGSIAVAQIIGFGARPDLLDYQVVKPGAPIEVDYENRTISYAGKMWGFR